MYTSGLQGKSSAILLPVLVLSSAMGVVGCASNEQGAKPAEAEIVKAQKPNPVDPYENFNRSMYGFNMTLDRYFLRPVADSYKTVTPGFVQTGVTNFFTNLKGINVVLNDVLQGKFEQGASDVGRFTTNSTIGLLGLFDVATDFGFQNNVEDFGQTLAVWGVEQGPYLVLPILGPTTARDGSAIIVDKAANPSTYVPGTGILEGVSDRANAQGALNFIDEAALDPYVFMRESFLQYRNNLVNDGKTSAENYELDLDQSLDKDTVPAAKKTVVSAKTTSATVGHAGQALDNSKKSLDLATQEFEEASKKLDKLAKKRRGRRR